MEILIKRVNNGFHIWVKDSVKGGDYVFRGIDDIPMMEFIGKLLCDAKVKVMKQ